MKEQFSLNLRLSKANNLMLKQINGILERYTNDGFVLTLRQLYYQLVSQNVIPNHAKEYGKLSKLLKEGRMSGIVDWAAIEDRVRRPKQPYWCLSVQDAVNDTINQYRLNRMRNQKNRIEVWVEKDALSNVLYRVTEKYQIPLMVNRGYSSVSAMYEAAKRLSDGDVILYFGDHDPSGLDMVRDIKNRFNGFGTDIKVEAIALTMGQIKRYNCPPNPAKISDPRAVAYITEHGNSSWELDALPIEVLLELVEDAILERIDLEAYQDILEQEKDDIQTLKGFFKS